MPSQTDPGRSQIHWHELSEMSDDVSFVENHAKSPLIANVHLQTGLVKLCLIRSGEPFGKHLGESETVRRGWKVQK